MRARIFGCASFQRISEKLGEIISEPNSIFGFLAKKYPNCKKNRSNRSLDDGDIVDLKLALLLENFATAGQLQCARAKNLHALRNKMHAKL